MYRGVSFFFLFFASQALSITTADIWEFWQWWRSSQNSTPRLIPRKSSECSWIAAVMTRTKSQRIVMRGRHGVGHTSRCEWNTFCGLILRSEKFIFRTFETYTKQNTVVWKYYLYCQITWQTKVTQYVGHFKISGFTTYSQHGLGSCGRLSGEPQYLETFRSHLGPTLSLAPPRDRDSARWP